MTSKDTPTEAAVQQVGDWCLVTYGNWQVSVSPDGLLMLPRHLHPREWADFVAAGSVAIQEAAKIIEANQDRAKNDDRTPMSSAAIITEGPPPAGAMRMMTTPGPNQPVRQSAAIGRPRRNGRVRPSAPAG